MADIIHTININSDNFSRLKTYLDTNIGHDIPLNAIREICNAIKITAATSK